MSKPTSALARLLETPHLAQLVPQLPPETLHQLIRHSGLDACGEIVAVATPEQLRSVLDLDLWRHSQAGRDEHFDADRFGEWIDVLVDTGEAVAARIVAAMDEHLVVTGLSRYIRVFDLGSFTPSAQSDDEPFETSVTKPDGMECEVAGYLVSGIRTDAWDAIVSLLVALSEGHREYFQAVMSGCRSLSNSTPEVDGLDELLMAPEQLAHNVAVDREQRRSEQGYSTPADARAFLTMARQRKATQASGVTNPIAMAYFRASEEASPAPASAEPHESTAEGFEAVADVLAEAGVVQEKPKALLAGAAPEPARLERLRQIMEQALRTNESSYLSLNREMAFLANTLIAGCSLRARPFTPKEASDAAGATCNLGLERWPAKWPDANACETPLVLAFELGWAALHQDVSMSVADRLIATLKNLESADADIRAGLKALRRELVKQRKAGTPWRAHQALDVLATLDTPSSISLGGLLSECPVIPAALTATLRGQIGAISATAFEFISTPDQIAEVRTFMERLPDALAP